MTDTQPITPPTRAERIGHLIDAYLDASEALTTAILDPESVAEGVIQLRYLSLIAALEGLLPALAGKEVNQC